MTSAVKEPLKNQLKQRDLVMSSTKNNQWHFGMKASIGVDPAAGWWVRRKPTSPKPIRLTFKL